MKELSIYLHIPFCVRKCLYCDFLSFPVLEDTLQGNSRCYANLNRKFKQEISRNYVNLLCQEITAFAPQYNKYRVISVFFGGGTPSLLSDGEISRIMETIRRHYRLAEDAEITIEMNPDTVTEDKLREYQTAGINRISIGLQSADDKELVRIGRIHDYKTFEKAYVLARKIGFCNINIDLMAALPEQSVASYERTLKNVAALKPEHISAYSLTLEEGTPLYERREEHCFPTEEEDREMYALTGEYLASCGYHRYEISNYAQYGCECRHNKVYWQRGNYVGFGLGASSMTENVRWTNPADMEQYRDYVERLSECGSKVCGQGEDTLEKSAQSVQNAEVYGTGRHFLTVQEQMEEHMFLGLRMMRGVDEQVFAERFGSDMDAVYGDIIARLCDDGLLIREQGHVRLTLRGIDVSNYVMAQFLFG